MGTASTFNKDPLRAVSTQEHMTVSRVTPVSGHLTLTLFTTLTGIVTLGLLVVYLVTAVNWRAHPFLGVMLTNTLVVNNAAPTGERTTWQGQAAGLLPGDHLRAINGVPLASNAQDYATANATFNELMAQLEYGSSVTLDFERPLPTTMTPAPGVTCAAPQGAVVPCQVTFTPGFLPAGDFLAFFLLPYLVGVALAAAGFIVLVLRGKQSNALIVAIICFLMALGLGGIFDAGSTHLLVPAWLAALSLMGGFFAMFGMIFPTRMRQLHRLPWFQFVPLGIAVVVMLYAISLLTPSTPQVAGNALYLAGGFMLFCLFLMGISMNYQRRYAISTQIRNQANTVLIGAALLLLPSLFWVIPRGINALGIGIQIPFQIETGMIFLAVVAGSMIYSVLQSRRVETDRWVSQGLVYLLLLGALVVGYALLVLGATLLTVGTLQPNDAVLIALTIFVISMLFLPVRSALQRRIEALYFRIRYNYQELTEEFAQQVSGTANYDEILSRYLEQINNALSPGSVLIFLRSPDGQEYIAYGKPKPATDVRFPATSGIVQMLEKSDYIYIDPNEPWQNSLISERTRLQILQAQVITALKGAEQLSGFVSISAPRQRGKIYSYEDLRFIKNLSRQMAIAVERAQVIESLERRVHELNVLSQVSQAVNYTLQYDDLLELIATQTDRLIRTQNLYIVLRDQTIEQLYFAFFLENDDRQEDKENRRFTMGRDLYSEIIRKGRALRLDNFAAEMAKRNMPVVYETPTLRAWMGVPLIAGPTIIGVLAIASSEARTVYTEEQLKIFNDIGTLAASSLDKARLFEETALRARQLAALNTVSQKLVAAELNVEQLLKQIMTSAVEILNAEAGSLLLTTDDDDSKQLEFRVVIGGSGDALVGQRLPANKGLVGEVVANRSVVIVNDAANDPRWGGEVAKGGFHTAAILAAPLIAKDRVIGVLEIINKKGGSVFVNSDADLLTTFAGQAAIAIENARLFQMTDFQLAERVKELEALERIDVELNRTRDPVKVAEITMKWCIANTGATAGVLGLVSQNPPRMRILTSYGYSDADLPAGATHREWSLERGIVARVLRTRRADLAPDLSIDPDYLPALRGSRSQITVPMMSGGEITSILVLESSTSTPLNILDLALVQRIADHASIAIDNARLYEQLTERLSSKSEFMSFAAHELKQPLSSVKGFADLLRGGKMGGLSEMQASVLNTIYSSADRMQVIIDDLRDSAKAEEGKLNIDLTPISFYNVVLETLRPFHKQFDDKGQQIVNNVKEDLPLVMGDSNRLIQVLTNFVSNAHKYSPEGSSITINAEVEADATQMNGLPINTTRTSNQLRVKPMLHISVRDNGIGMSDDDVQRLFNERYFRSDNPEAREQPGTGLGMMITRSIIELHHGRVWVESELGKGSAFHFTIPLASEKQIHAARSADAVDEPEGEAEKETASD